MVGRVAARLVELAGRYGEASARGVRITLPLCQEQLAGSTGASREAVSKALRTMRELDWVQTERRQITVRDVDALCQRASVSVSDYAAIERIA